MRDEIYVEGIDLRDVSQSASRIHLSCRVKKKISESFWTVSTSGQRAQWTKKYQSKFVPSDKTTFLYLSPFILGWGNFTTLRFQPPTYLLPPPTCTNRNRSIFRCLALSMSASSYFMFRDCLFSFSLQRNMILL